MSHYRRPNNFKMIGYISYFNFVAYTHSNPEPYEAYVCQVYKLGDNLTIVHIWIFYHFLMNKVVCDSSTPKRRCGYLCPPQYLTQIFDLVAIFNMTLTLTSNLVMIFRDVHDYGVIFTSYLVATLTLTLRPSILLSPEVHRQPKFGEILSIGL